MNRLTSMCYPEYHVGTGTGLTGKSRMKPPLAKFRLGALFGSHNKEMIGFIETLSYEFPIEGTWETRMGKRVPKLITVTMDWRVIHGQTPSLAFAQSGGEETFYGMVNENSVTSLSNVTVEALKMTRQLEKLIGIGEDIEADGLDGSQNKPKTPEQQLRDDLNDAKKQHDSQ